MTTLRRDWIAARIPHSGSMCLLDEVVEWNADGIRCSATSHLAPDNPLRSQDRLAPVCGVEYAAQAMAVHGALAGTQTSRPRVGLLASVRALDIHVDRLDTLDGPLDVKAERIGGDDNTVLYRFTIRCADRAVLEGRAAVMLDAARALSGE